MDSPLDSADSRPIALRLPAGLQAHPLVLEAGALVVALAVFLVSVLPHLADHPVLTDDEAWVISASFKLAREGVFGSDMFAGFFHADTHYFFNMPAHHFLVAAAFKLLGYGIAQARLIGVGYGVATLLLSYLLARRIYGAIAAVVAVGLLLWLRLNMGFDTGLPLQELASNLRYDLAPVPFLLGGVLVLLGAPSIKRAAVAGALFGVATLLQFYGAFLFPIALAFLWLERQQATSDRQRGSEPEPALPRGERLRLCAALLAAGALVGLPYGVYIASDLTDFRGQAGTIDRRDAFTDPRFYLDNLRHEPDRFVRPLAIPYAFTEVPAGLDPFVVAPQKVGIEALKRRPSAKLGIILGLPAALIFASVRAQRLSSRGDRMLALCLGGLVLEYALLDSTKFYYYWIPVVPLLCVGLGGAVVWLLQPPRGSPLRLFAAAATALVLLIVVAEGSVARFNGFRTASDAASYDTLASAIHESIPPGARVVGSTSLWWGLRDTDYRSYFLFFYLTRPDAGPYRDTISGFLGDFDAQYVVLTRVSQAELQRHLIPPDYTDFDSYMAAHATHVTRLEAPVARAYGYVDIWRLNR